MQAYFKENLQNNWLVIQAETLYNSKFISKKQEITIDDNLQKLKTSTNIFVRLGFALLGSFLLSSIIGSVSLLLLSIIDHNFNAVLFFYTLVTFICCEIIAKQNFYTHGIDDAFIIGLQIIFCSAIGVFTEMHFNIWPISISMIFIGLFCFIRYVNTLAVLTICLGLVITIADLVVNYNIFISVYLPFVGLFLAIIIYFVGTKFIKKNNLFYYQNGFNLAIIFSYLLGYFSLNYLVVRQLSEELLHFEVHPNQDIPFAYLFYFFTFAIPAAYFYFALKNHNRSLLYIAVFTLCFSIFTIRFYHSVLPIEVALTLSGVILFLIAFFAIKFLKNKPTGVTFIQDRNNNKSILLNAQALIINSQINTNAAPQSDMEFGGGDFSGGGAGESF